MLNKETRVNSIGTQLENIKKSYNGMEALVAPVQLRSASHRGQKVEKRQK
jgi:hypothetical protein